MPDPATDLQRKLNNVRKFLTEDYADLAEDIQEFARRDSVLFWQRDTGSARASLTAFCAQRGAAAAYAASQSDTDWQTARLNGSQKYTMWPYNNRGPHYDPQEYSASYSDPTIVLTGYVRYLPVIEAGLFDHVSAEYADIFLRTTARAIDRALRS